MIRTTTRTLSLKYVKPKQRQKYEWVVPATPDPIDKRTRSEIIVSRGYFNDTASVLTSIRIDDKVAVLTSPQRNALIIALADARPSSERSASRSKDGQAT